MTIDEPLNFGQRMMQLRKERGQPLGGPGRRPIRERYKRQIDAVERTFADALPHVAREYLDELRVQEPEVCPEHRRVLQCPEPSCRVKSQRTRFDHRAGQYVIDRLLGKPVFRSQNALQVNFVKETAQWFAEAFNAANDLATAYDRAEFFSAKLIEYAGIIENDYQGVS